MEGAAAQDETVAWEGCRWAASLLPDVLQAVFGEPVCVCVQGVRTHS